MLVSTRVLSYRNLECISISAFMQTSLSVRVMTPTTVMRMHSALTQRGVSAVPATLVTLEMESLVQVQKIILKSHLCTLSIYGHCMHNTIHSTCRYQ